MLIKMVFLDSAHQALSEHAHIIGGKGCCTQETTLHDPTYKSQTNWEHQLGESPTLDRVFYGHLGPRQTRPI